MDMQGDHGKGLCMEKNHTKGEGDGKERKRWMNVGERERVSSREEEEETM